MPYPVLSARNPVRALLPLVGNTPFVEVRYELDGRPRRLFAKCETLNMTGSIKDRIAVQILGHAYERGAIAPGDEIVEATSGNTGIAFAAVGRALGHPVRIFMPDWLSAERFAILEALGVVTERVSRDAGGFLGAIAAAEDYVAAGSQRFLPRQFSNEANVDAHDFGTGREILAQLGALGLRADAFVAGIGTGGTVMGVARAFRRFDPSISVHPLEPANSPILTAGRKVGHHRIQGISDEFVPDIVDLAMLAPIVSVDDGDSIRMAQRLGAELGLAVGISSGANFLGAAMVANEHTDNAIVVTVFPDSNKKYLSTDLVQKEPKKSDHWTDRVSLASVRALPRPAAELREALFL